MGIYEFKFPELGEGLHEGKIERWTVQVGDRVQEDDVIAEVENDKAMVELTSPVSGKVRDIRLKTGASAVVGDIIVIFEIEEARTSESNGVATVSQASAEIERHSRYDIAAGTNSLGHSTVGDVRATPRVRKYARENRVNIAQVRATGTNGKITLEDVDDYLSRGERMQDGVTTSGWEEQTQLTTRERSQGVKSSDSDLNAQLEERIPVTSIRKIIAAAMVRSKHTAPHVTVMDEVNVTKLVRFRSEMKPLAAERGVKLSYLPFIIKALIGALRQYPTLNASYDDAAEELIVKHYYHLGIATATERGLLVPVIKHADHKSIFTLASEITDLSTRARENKLGPAEMKGSSISITNIGPLGGLFFTPILNYPEVAIMGVNRVTEKPIVQDGAIVPAQMLALSMSFDHRIVDGALAQRFINELKRLLENPNLLMMEV